MQNHRAVRTIDVLLRAFMRGELKHGRACECAVGNMLNRESDWAWMVVPTWCQSPNADHYAERAMTLIDASGYSLAEIKTIEVTFEGRHDEILGLNYRTDPDSYKGLCAVFDLMMDDIDSEYFEARSPIVLHHDFAEVVG